MGEVKDLLTNFQPLQKRIFRKLLKTYNIGLTGTAGIERGSQMGQGEVLNMTRLARLAALGMVAMSLVVGASSVANAAPVNLVTNGDFTSGDTGFTSEYVYKTPGINDLWDPGVFSVTTSALNNHSLWETAGDNTSGNGDFMLVNGYTDRPGRTVWSQTVNVNSNTNYFFEAFSKNLCCSTLTLPTADLSFLINGIVVGGGGAQGLPGLWSAISTQWNSAGATTAVLEIRDGVTVYSGNDFGLDDIYLGTESSVAPEPASLALLGTAAALAWRERRRRQRNRS